MPIAHTCWLMPRGARECSLKIQDSSCLLLNPVSLGPNFGVHHSNTENSMCETLWFSVVKCLDTGVLLVGFGFETECLCSYILFLNSLQVSPTYIILHFLQVIR